jgi:hypothetical protein
MEYTKNTEAPWDFHYWTAIMALSSAVERRVWIDSGHFQWVANFFVLLVGRPGIVNKSTSLRIGQRILRQTGKAHFGPSSMSWQALLDAFREGSQEFVIGQEHFRQSPLSLWISEFGNFFDPSNRELVDLMTHMWDGEADVFSRRTRKDGELDIVNPWVTMIACVTPSWLRENFTAGLIGGGFASRAVVVFGEKKERLIAYPGISTGGPNLELESKLVQDLKSITNLKGPMRLTPEAYAWGTAWYHWHYDTMVNGLFGRMEGYNSRKQSHLHKIAMALSLAESDSLIITQAHLQSAYQLLTRSEQAMGTIIGGASNMKGQHNYAVDLLEHMKSLRNSISRKDLYTALWNQSDYKLFDQAVTDLTRAGKIKSVALPGGDLKLTVI